MKILPISPLNRGCDRLSVSFPVSDFAGSSTDDISQTPWNSGGSTRDGLRRRNGAVEVRGVPCFVGFADVPWRDDRDNMCTRMYGKVEFNPSRLLDPEGASLAPFEDVAGLAAEVLDAAERLVTMDCRPGEARVKRVDVAVDVSCKTGGVEFYLAGLSKVRPAWARERRLWQDPERNHAQSLWVGSGAGGVRAYDKHAEKPALVRPGMLRVEAECRADWAEQYGGLKLVDDLEAGRLEKLLRNRWDWGGMGTPVSATDLVIDRLLRSSNPLLLMPDGRQSSAKVSRVLGDIILASRRTMPNMSNDRRSAFNALVAELGVPINDGPVQTKPADLVGFVGRLDYDSGAERIEAAA